MTRIHLLCVSLLVLFLASCGSNSPAPKTIDGAWSASVVNPDQSEAYSFTISLNEEGPGSAVTIVGFNFKTDFPCFPNPLGQTATFSATGHSGGFETGPFTLNISTAFGTGVENVLALTGTRNADGTITGSWTLSGLAGCSGNGTYTMTLLPTM